MPYKEGRMKKLIAGMLFVVFAVGVMPVLAKQAQTVEVLINKQVAAQGGVKIAFVELVEDSRCPVDVDCVWAGNAKIRVRDQKRAVEGYRTQYDERESSPRVRRL